MLKLTLQDLIDYVEQGEITLDSCLYGLLSLMQAAIQNAHHSHQAANDRAVARNLRQALRCVNPFVRFARERAELLPDCVKLLRVVLCLAETEMQRAQEDGRDSAPFVGVAISCQIFLARIIDKQTKATAAAAHTEPTVVPTPAEPAAAAQRTATAAPQAPAATTATAYEPPETPRTPLTQRAKWLAAQRRKDRKRNSA